MGLCKSQQTCETQEKSRLRPRFTEVIKMVKGFSEKQIQKMFRLRTGKFNTKAYNQFMKERKRSD